ncbi:conjugative transfer signal peptidase TraF [Rhizobium leguminosarum]|uniref:conjugative transfer signal peptidase TraF n=1 Tax=Rhizobium leguminosarum TaxID=384 RepID=UPI001C97FEE8|nr:conjugative transfer signal peptidase TraF [Rhizobium leguminosarum]MBY5760199.1 conjugative transfer signal peptidase TraF [Rhizobium leguminosarum]
MTPTASQSRVKSLQRRQAGQILSAAAAIAGLLVLAATSGGFRINMTPSEPLGLWRIVTLRRPPAVGDLVFICPPDTEAMWAARSRGYLRSGLCPGGLAPLIKTVIATAGQGVEIGSHVRVDGILVASSAIARADGKGRSLSPFAGGTVPADTVFLHSRFVGSYDSRYFGPLPVSGILGLAQEVLTYAP